MAQTSQSRLWRKGLLALALSFGCTMVARPQAGGRSGEPSAVAPGLAIPSVTSAFTIDGVPDEAAWQSALVLPLQRTDHGITEAGGEILVAVQGDYLCLGARLPESGRLVARSTGVNPVWWREDLVVWMLRYRSPITDLNMSISLAVNPLGAFSLWGAAGGGTSNSRAYPLENTGNPLDWGKDVLAAASLGPSGWGAETAIPLKQLGTVGFLSAQRVRAPRPDLPELSWHWPAPNARMNYSLSKGSIATTPFLRLLPGPVNHGEATSRVPETLLAREIAALPPQVWKPAEQAALETREMLERLIRRRMTESAGREKREWQAVDSRAAWERFRDARLDALRASLGVMPERTPLNAEVTRRINPGEGFVVENVIFESRPRLIVTANLYLPERPSGRIPAVVFVHSHHAPKTQSELQDLGMTWARAGTAVLVMDQLCAGERIQSQPWPREGYYGRYALGNQLYLAGESLIKWMAWDLMRGIDLLVERPEIDPRRIVLVGACAGGGDPAAVTAALDPRVAAVIPMNFGEAGPEEHYTEGPRPYDFDTADPGWAYWETTRNLRLSASGQFFPWFICASVAPRPFLHTFEVGWPETVEEEPAWARYKRVFEFYGARERLAEAHGLGPFPGPGEFTNLSTFLRRRIDPVLQRWLQIPVPEVEVHQLQPEANLMGLTPSAATARGPRTASALAFELAQQRLAAARARRAGLSASERMVTLRKDLAKKLGEIQPESTFPSRSHWKMEWSGGLLEAVSVESEPGISLPVLLLSPKANPERKPAVLALAQGGKRLFLAQRAEEIAFLLANGISVCLPDLRGDGEIGSGDSRGPEAMGLAGNELMLGMTSIGSRLKDVRTLFHWLAGRSDIDPNSIAVWGDSFSEPNLPGFQFEQSPGQEPGPVEQRQAEPAGALLALLAALYEDEVGPVAVRGGLISFSSVLGDRFCQVPQDAIVPGLLEVADLGDIAEVNSERPLLLEGLVDGLNKRAELEAVTREFGPATSRRQMRQEAGSLSVAEWLAAQLKRGN